MKRIFFKLMIISFFLPVHLNAQTTFERTYGGTDEDIGYSIRQTAEGGYIIAGWTRSFGAGGSDVYLIKTDTVGDTLWTKTYGGSSDDLGLSVQQTTDGGYVVAGWTASYGAGSEDVYLIKTDANGDTTWTKTYGGSQLDKGRSVQQTADGGYIIAGETFGTGSADVYLIKTDSNGDMVWSTSVNELLNDFGYSVQQTTDGGYVIAGYTQAMTGYYDAYLVKTNATGDVTWTSSYGGVSMDFALCVQQTVDDGYIMTGNTISFSPPPEDVYLIKTDANGDTTWTKTYGGTDEDAGYFVQQTNDGGYIVTGVTGSSVTGDYDVYLIRTDASGNESWTKTFGGGGNEQGYSIRQTDDGGFAITGQASSFGAGDADVYFIKTDESGTVGIHDNETPSVVIPKSYFLSQNYPNPFNPSTTIAFDIPETVGTKQPVILTIYDIRGRRVRTLIDSDLQPGSYTIHWDGRNDGEEKVASGIYLYTLRAGEERFTRKMTVLK